MTPQLQNILDLIKQSAQLNDADKAAIEKAIKETDKALEIANFKLDRTEKVKRTTAILLEETIAELEQKRKAVETQNRELEIESSLERVRTVAMGMKKPDDLLSICEILFKELLALGFSELRNALIHTYVDEKNYFDDYDFSDFTGGRISRIPYNSLPFIKKYLKEIRKSNDAFTEIELGGKELEEWKAFRRTSGQIDDPRLDSASALYYYNYSISVGDVGISTFHPITHEKREILKRFRNVFDLAYRRYIDIQQAEAQAREAQIEAALEKVRSRSLAMHQSDELEQVVVSLFDRLTELGLSFDGALIFTFEKEKRTIRLWIATNHLSAPVKIDLPYDEEIKNNAIIKDLWNAIENGKHIFNRSYSGETKNEYFRYVGKYNESKIPEAVRQLQIEKESWTACFAAEKNSVVGFDSWSGHIMKEEDFQIAMRFARVFEQAYTRFLDLKKAEVQAREAKIEAALERTRTQSMLMQHSKELDDTLRVFHQQILLLGINSAFSFLWLPDEDKDRHIFWAAWGEDQNDSTIFKSKAINYPLDRNEPATAQCLVDWKSEEPVHSYNVPPAQVENYFAAWAELFEGAENLKPEYFPNGLNYVEAFMKYGCFGVMIENELPEHEKKILLRFAIEFERTYTRFLDLQKAEAQAREAQIETALEKVRSRSLAMHKSDELNDVVMVLFEKLKELQIPVTAVGITIYIQGSKDMNMYVCGDIGNGLTVNSYHLPYFDHPITNDLYEVRERELDFFVGNYSKEEKDSFYKYLFNQSALKDLPGEIKNMIIQSPFYSVAMAPAKNSMINLNDFEGKSFSESQADVLKRFAKVFDQAYIRFLDLQKAEAQAREAQIEAALEKVRSRTMAMQSSDELADAAYVLFEQLNQLGIVHERINIGIVNEENQTIDFWVTGQGGNRITTRFSGRINEPTTLVKAYTAWKKGEKSLVIDQQGEDLQLWLKFMEEEIKIPFDKKYLHNRRVQTAGFFSKGMLVVTSPEPLQSEAIYLLEKFSGVFDLTYTRFNDLKIAEAHALQAEQDLIAIKEAKQKAEEALTELQLTQKQLIQSEKMASLGELTAGIAHEIQNPLNFVNNFSDVSKELLDEMKTELASGNLQLATEIADDVIGNLEKILHHGKRADGIVKGMLQHSRSSSGQKELTDINALTDEYLRLAYHGLRAKDKSFNAKFETDFDTSIGKIEVMPQEIGRVILNLINNAFYAVSERQKAEGKEFEPTVTISTKKTGDKVLISVKDNGNGIPDTIKEKIFQPFFTTKPTGQGTGLGLSLAYDIVKAHGGEIKVNTKEGGGTEFTISLPVNQ